MQAAEALKIFKNRILFLFLFAWISLPSFAEDIRMAFGESLPPYTLPGDEMGIEVEVVQKALAYRGHTLKSALMPMARLPLAYRNKNVDAIMMDVGEKVPPDKGFYSDPPVLYQNVLITLKKKNQIIKRPEDLKGLIINAFVGAEKRYPHWFSKPLAAGTYIEINDQTLQVLQLLRRRIDVVVSEYNIFKYYFFKTKSDVDASLDDFQIHHVLVENPLEYRPVFRSQKVRDDFNAGLAHLKASGEYDAIFKKYIKK